MSGHQVPIIVSGIIGTVIGIILNLLVFGIYIGKKSIPRSFANKLLLHQCFVDLVNLTVLILPYACSGLHFLLLLRNEAITRNEYFIKTNDTILVFLSLLPLSVLSSAFTFTLEAIDRLLASHSKEMYQKFTKKKVMIPVFIIIWSLSSVSSTIMFIGLFYMLPQDPLMLQDTIKVFWAGFKYFLDFMMFMNTILIGVAFYKSHKKLKSIRSSINEQEESQNLLEWVKRDFRLTLIFLVMYIIYLVPAIGLSIGVKNLFNQYHKYMYLVAYSLGIASILNPILTLTLKEDFKKLKVRSIN